MHESSQFMCLTTILLVKVCAKAHPALKSLLLRRIKPPNWFTAPHTLFSTSLQLEMRPQAKSLTRCFLVGHVLQLHQA